MKSRTSLTASLLALVALSSPATSESAGGSVCAAHDIVVDRLAASYSEVPAMRGRTARDHELVLFASPSYDTWTLTVRVERDITCLVSSGRGRQGIDDRLFAAR